MRNGGGIGKIKVLHHPTLLYVAAKSVKSDTRTQDEFLEQSDEEVLDYSSPSEDGDDDDDQVPEDQAGQDQDDDDDDDDLEAGRKRTSNDDEGEDEEAWGSSKQDYYNADAIETEQDALDEEAEALRIQKKQLQAMSVADYGFDETEWQNADAVPIADQADGAVVTEVLPQLEITDRMGSAERLKLLRSRYPEFEPLSKELLDLQKHYKHFESAAALSQSMATGIKRQAAAAYLATLTMYFALLTSTADDGETKGVALSANALRDHPVMDSLVQCRDLWMNVKDLPEDDDQLEATASEQSDSESVDDLALDALAAQLEKSKPQKVKKTKAQKAAQVALEEAASRRAQRMARAETDLADLDLLAASTSRPANKTKSRPQVTPINDDDSDFGEDTGLTAQELADKAKRKKSLRFYTSQIAQKANKRGAAGRNAGGDDDIPHRERLRDRQARLNAEAENRGKRETEGQDELGQDSDDEDRRQAREIRAAADSDEEYYDLVAAKASKKKSDKKAAADVHKEAAQQGGRVVQKEEVGPDGKRAITYAIEKNKGLTPHRKKDVRNPRVKKRKKYDEKKKKLASMRPTYKGGEGRGGYGGELTGIKKGVVRSTKL